MANTNFELLGLKKLISTSYTPESKKYKLPYQPTLFETQQTYFNPDMYYMKDGKPELPYRRILIRKKHTS
ncbi:MAG: hypothetical protein J6T18_07845 [Bacteroidaceae bacterium]|nr:hypothetical protein [Bacteroidaceae bacterium]